MNPYVILATVILWGGTVTGAFFYGQSIGKDGEIAKQAEIKQVIDDTREAARQGAASEISKLKVRHTTIKGKLETVIRDNPVYRDCKLDASGMQLINEALTSQSSRTGRDGSSSLPATNGSY